MYDNVSGVHSAWTSLLRRILCEGAITPSRADGRSNRTKELFAEQLFVEDMRKCVLVCPERRPNYRFMVAEWLWMMMGRNDVAPVARFTPGIADFSDNGRTFYGAYGPHVVAQLPDVISRLKADWATRQAVVDIWRDSPHPPTKDVPCTLNMQFLVRENRLRLVVNMRSSDAWLGVPYDAFNFMMLGNAVAGELELEPGTFALNMASSHLYERDWEAAQQVLAHAGFNASVDAPPLPGLPPSFFNAVLDDPEKARPEIPVPWSFYASALRVRTSGSALELLDLAGDDVKEAA